jgi:parvulin-like peptidyl-prolyl isomerase
MRKIVVLFVFLLFSVSVYAEDATVVKVNGTTLTKKDLETEVDRLIPQITFHRSIPEEKRKNFYGQALEELINRELQYQYAVAQGMTPDKKQVDMQMEGIRKHFKSNEGYETFLSKENLNEEKLRAKVEKDILVQKVVTKMVTEPSLMDEVALKDYYEKNVSMFKRPESVRLKLIATKDEKKAQEILEKVKAGEDFGGLAANMSEDAYRVKDGDIGYVHKGRMLTELEHVAFKLKVGETSGLIEVKGVWFIIKVEDKRPEKQLSFDDVKEKLKKEIETKKSQELQAKWMSDLRSKAKIEVFLKTEATNNKP